MISFSFLTFQILDQNASWPIGYNYWYLLGYVLFKVVDLKDPWRLQEAHVTKSLLAQDTQTEPLAPDADFRPRGSTFQDASVP